MECQDPSELEGGGEDGEAEYVGVVLVDEGHVGEPDVLVTLGLVEVGRQLGHDQHPGHVEADGHDGHEAGEDLHPVPELAGVEVSSAAVLSVVRGRKTTVSDGNIPSINSKLNPITSRISSYTNTMAVINSSVPISSSRNSHLPIVT